MGMRGMLLLLLLLLLLPEMMMAGELLWPAAEHVRFGCPSCFCFSLVVWTKQFWLRLPPPRSLSCRLHRPPEPAPTPPFPVPPPPPLPTPPSPPCRPQSSRLDLVV